MKLSQYLRIAVSVNEVKRKHPDAVEDIDLALKQGLLQKHLNWFAIHRLDAPIPKLVELSKQFEKLSQRMDHKDKNIDSWNKKSIPELENFLNSTGSVNLRKTQGAKLVAENDMWYVYHITTKEAAIEYGKGTKWCISNKNLDHNLFDEYKESLGATYLFLIRKYPLSGKGPETRINKIAVSMQVRKTEVWDYTNNMYKKGEKRTGRKLQWLKAAIGNDFYNKLVPIIKKLSIKSKDFIATLYTRMGGRSTEKGWVFEGDCNLYNLGLKEIPEKICEVRGDLNINFNKLKILNNLPEKVGGSFYCDNNELISLKGCPGEVGGSFFCHENKLLSLDGCPKEVIGDFNCSGNKLVSLEGGPREVSGSFHCMGNRLTSLSGSPRTINGTFDCSVNNLVSLDGGPERVNGDYYCSRNKLKSLVGAPKETEWFKCNNNNEMKYFGGGPGKKGTLMEVRGNFECQNCGLLSLEGGPQRVDIDYRCRYNPGKFTVEYVEDICSVGGYVMTDRREDEDDSQ